MNTLGEGHSDRLECAAFSPDSAQIMSACEDQYIQLPCSVTRTSKLLNLYKI